MEFLASPLFRYLIFPLGSVGIGIAIKYASISDKFDSFKKEDVAVGLELFLTAVLMYIVLTTDRVITLIGLNESLSDMLKNPSVNTTEASALQARIIDLTGKTASSGWIILGMFLFLWAISTVVRKVGWRGANDIDIWIGIALPLVSGVLALILVMVEASK